MRQTQNLVTLIQWLESGLSFKASIYDKLKTKCPLQSILREVGLIHSPPVQMTCFMNEERVSSMLIPLLQNQCREAGGEAQ